MKTNKIFLTSAICMCMMAPTYANIGANESEPGCIESKIGATSGDTNMEAIWGANTINLVYTADGTTFTPTNSTANSCTYDQHVVIPTNEPTKTGYTFDGWRVVAGLPQCSLSGLDTSISATSDATHTRWKPLNGDDGNTMQKYYGTDNSSDLNDGEWAVTFSYGTIKGEAICSTTEGNRTGLWTGSSYSTNYNPLPDNIRSDIVDGMGAWNARQCWCRATNYTPNGEDMCSVSPSSWVFRMEENTYSSCLSECPESCAGAAMYYSGFRTALLFGVSN